MSEIPDGALYLVSKFPLLTINRKTPWLLKGGYHEELEVLIVLLTDLSSSYFSFMSYDDIEAAHQLYNPKMKAPLHDIVSILHFILTEDKLQLINPVYSGEDGGITDGLSPGDATFEVHKRAAGISVKVVKMIKIYPFSWQFNFEPLDQQQHEAVLKQLIVCPLLGLVNSLDTKYNRLLDSYQQSRDYLTTKLSAHELKLFKQNYKEDESEWKFCMRVDQRDELMPRLNGNESMRHFQLKIGQFKSKGLRDPDYEDALRDEVRERKRNAAKRRKISQEEEKEEENGREQEEKQIKQSQKRANVRKKKGPPEVVRQEKRVIQDEEDQAEEQQAPDEESPPPAPKPVAKKKKKKIGGFL